MRVNRRSILLSVDLGDFQMKPVGGMTTAASHLCLKPFDIRGLRIRMVLSSYDPGTIFSLINDGIL